MHRFLAMIVPIRRGPVDPGYGVPEVPGDGGPPPGVWPGPGPSHPIVLPGDPSWGTGGGPQPPGGSPSHPIFIPGEPSHPIVILPPPPGSGDGAPGIPVHLPIYPWTPSHPIVLPPPGTPSHPIATPPPGQPTHPIATPPGTPAHPIVLPPTMPDPDNRPIDWKTAWTPETGWVVVGVPSGDRPIPTPSAATPKR